MRLDIRRIESIKSGDSAIGNKVRVKVVKNKTAQPFREAFFDIIFGQGISKEGSLIDTAVEMEIIEKSGTWLSYGEVKLGQGRDAAKAFLKEHSDVFSQIEKKVKEKSGLLPAPPSAAGTAPAAGAPNAQATVSPAAPKEKADPKKEAAAFVPTEKAKLALKK